jgi:hypothetical protein
MEESGIQEQMERRWRAEKAAPGAQKSPPPEMVVVELPD